MSQQKPFEIPKQAVWDAYRRVAANKGALRLWEQGSASPRVVRLAADDLVLQVPRQRYVTVGHHVLAARASGASLSVDLFHLRQEVVYRVQVVARFGLLATPTPLGGRIPFESEELDRASGTVRDMKHSVGWR